MCDPFCKRKLKQSGIFCAILLFSVCPNVLLVMQISTAVIQQNVAIAIYGHEVSVYCVSLTSKYGKLSISQDMSFTNERQLSAQNRHPMTPIRSFPSVFGKTLNIFLKVSLFYDSHYEKR